MKSETQAIHLEKMMQRHKRHPEYELALPLFLIKYSTFKKLSIDDVFLLGLNALEFILINKGEICAKAELLEYGNSQKIKIIYLEKDTLKQSHTKKYEEIKCLFSTLQIKKLELGCKISIEQLDLQEVKLFVKDEYIADGTLVKVDDEIAIEIKKVYNE